MNEAIGSFKGFCSIYCKCSGGLNCDNNLCIFNSTSSITLDEQKFQITRKILYVTLMAGFLILVLLLPYAYWFYTKKPQKISSSSTLDSSI